MTKNGAYVSVNSGGIAHKSKRTSLPDMLADRFIAQIFNRELRPGDRLPPERQLAEQLSVDRTSLRMALLILKRMNLVSVVQGSGIVVQDYERAAGLDFLASIFDIEALAGNPALIAQVIDWANVNLPTIFGMATKRATPEGLRQQELIYQEIASCGDDLDRATELALAGQDHIANALGNIVVSMTFNSTRRLRQRLLRLVIEQVGPIVYANFQLQIVRGVMAGTLSAADVEESYRSYLPTVTDGLRVSLFSDEEE